MLSGNSDFENNLLIEHASDATVFKEFRCGIKKMDDFIHEGLDLSVKNNFCKLYKVSRDEEIVALFALSFDSLILDYEDKTELKQTESVGVDSRYEEVFWSKRHYPALEIAYEALSKAKEMEQDYSATAFYYNNHFESCELPNVSKDTLRMYRPLYLN